VKDLIDTKKLNARPVHPFEQIPVQYRSVQEISDHLTFYSTLPKYLHWEDRNSMAHSVEARVPFLDHRLVEFASGLPDWFLEKDGINKRVMREAMNGLIRKGLKTEGTKWALPLRRRFG
jgi:asparagine synthase (glutamine-hydrolysing)